MKAIQSRTGAKFILNLEKKNPVEKLKEKNKKAKTIAKEEKKSQQPILLNVGDAENALIQDEEEEEEEAVKASKIGGERIPIIAQEKKTEGEAAGISEGRGVQVPSLVIASEEDIESLSTLTNSYKYYVARKLAIGLFGENFAEVLSKVEQSHTTTEEEEEKGPPIELFRKKGATRPYTSVVVLKHNAKVAKLSAEQRNTIKSEKKMQRLPKEATLNWANVKLYCPICKNYRKKNGEEFEGYTKATIGNLRKHWKDKHWFTKVGVKTLYWNIPLHLHDEGM